MVAIANKSVTPRLGDDPPHRGLPAGSRSGLNVWRRGKQVYWKEQSHYDCRISRLTARTNAHTTRIFLTLKEARDSGRAPVRE